MLCSAESRLLLLDALLHTHAHTHTHTFIYIYTYIYCTCLSAYVYISKPMLFCDYIRTRKQHTHIAPMRIQASWIRIFLSIQPLDNEMNLRLDYIPTMPYVHACSLLLVSWSFFFFNSMHPCSLTRCTHNFR